MLAAPTYSANAQKYISQLVGVEACPIPDSKLYYPAGLSDDDYTQLAQGLSLLGIDSVLGPNWDSQLNLICFITGSSSEVCTGLRSIDVLSATNPWGNGQVGVKHMKHLGQTSLTASF